MVISFVYSSSGLLLVSNLVQYPTVHSIISFLDVFISLVTGSCIATASGPLFFGTRIFSTSLTGGSNRVLRQKTMKQAGLSRATLEISFEFYSNFTLFTHFISQSIQWLMRYCLHFEDFKDMVWSSKLKFKIWVWSKKGFEIFRLWSFKLKVKNWVGSNKWLLRYSTFNILGSSSIEVHLHGKDLYNTVWSSELKFRIWAESNKWLLRYTAFDILRSSSVRGRLPLQNMV